MTNKTPREQATEKMDGFIEDLAADVKQYGLTDSITVNVWIKESARTVFFQIINELGYVQKAKDQTPPKIEIPSHSRSECCPHCGEEFGYENIAEAEQHEAQDNMISANFVKVEKE